VILGILLCICVGWVASAESSAGVEESLEILRRQWRNENNPQAVEVLRRAKADPEFRIELIDALMQRLEHIELNKRSGKECWALRMLKASEALEQLRQRWNKMEKKTYGLEFADSRSQLLRTIAALLPEEQSVQFLIETERDEAEPPKIRARATILLCASGDEKAIEHVLSVYEQAKRKYPTTTRVPREDQPKPPTGQKKAKRAALRRAPEERTWDKDNDMMSDYIEQGLLLDPSNRDTDGDGLLDGNDRNPFSKPGGAGVPDANVAENRQIANFLFYFYARRDGSDSPFAFNLWILHKTDNYDRRKVVPSFFNGMELTGINGIALHMDKDQINEYRSIHGWGTKEINIHEMKESYNGEREFRLSISQGRADHRSYRIQVKRFNGVWLPVYWELGIIT
jgi:hypothetical protein